jgi:hypothetical protein
LQLGPAAVAAEHEPVDRRPEQPLRGEEDQDERRDAREADEIAERLARDAPTHCEHRGPRERRRRHHDEEEEQPPYHVPEDPSGERCRDEQAEARVEQRRRLHEADRPAPRRFGAQDREQQARPTDRQSHDQGVSAAGYGGGPAPPSRADGPPHVTQAEPEDAHDVERHEDAVERHLLLDCRQRDHLGERSP